MIILLSLWLHLYVNYTPIWIAVLIGNMALAAILPGIFIVKEFGMVDTRIPLAIAIIFLAISCFYTATFDMEINFARIAYSRVLAGIGLALFLPPIFRLAFFSFPQNASLEIVSIFHGVRTIACALGTGLYTILWQRRQIFYHERLGSQLTAFSMETKQFFKNAKQQFDIQGLFADARLEFFLDRQATSLALDDCFWLMGWILVGLLVLICFTFFFPKDDFFPEKKRTKSAQATTL
jgi:MFS transporter, DHA2 family, multidrug resistance protein